MNTYLSVQDLQKLAANMQNDRLLTLSFPEEDAPYDVLLVNRLEGEEHLSRDFRFTIEILSDNAELDPSEFTGKRITVHLLRNDGTFRHFNGYVFSFRLVRTDGGIAFYEAEAGPWLHYLTLRKNNRLFLDRSVHGQTAAIFEDYGHLPVWEWKVYEADPAMTMACQFDEHDHNYVHRRWESLGLTYWYEHTAREHKLKVSDPVRTEPAIDGSSPEIRYQSEAGSQEADGIASWSPVQRISSTHVALSRADFKDPSLTARTGDLAESRIGGSSGSNAPKLEWYDYAGAYGYRNTNEGRRLAGRRVEAIEATARQYEARGNNRFVMPGRWFRLTDHFAGAVGTSGHDDEYVIVSARHSAANNYLQGAGAEATYRNVFTCLARRTPWRPPRGYNSVDTRILAPQTALVVGPPGESLFTDQYGRCLLQFHWDREGKYTTWVRVASGWAGGGQGMTALPRIGSEVIVQWLDGIPDHPIVTGRVPNARNLSAWQLPHQRALTGIRSRELSGDAGNRAGGRSNHLVFDDTAGAMQTQLRSDHEGSQLSLGSVTRIDDWHGRREARGEGFELRTDANGAVRTGKGMLVSTEGVPAAKTHITEVGKPASRLTKAQQLHERLAEVAVQHHAQDGAADQAHVADVLRAQSDSIKGVARGEGSFPQLSDPHLLLAGAAGIELTTPATVHLSGGQHMAVTSGENVSLAAGKSLFASVSEKLSLFAHRMGMKLIAASGKVQVQAQNDDLELLAKKVVAIISTTDWINITAKQGIRLNAGDSELVINRDGIKGYTLGQNVMHASDHQTVGPKSMPTVFPGVPDSFCERCFELAARSGTAIVPR